MSIEGLAVEGLADPRVLPRVTDVNRPFFAAAARGQLVLPRCARCAAVFFYPRPACPTCHGRDISWIDASGRGIVRVAVPVHRPPWDDLPRVSPYVVALVQLAEGPTMLSTIEGAEPDAVSAGLAVRAVFERVGGDVGLVRFAPSDPTGPGVATPTTDR